MFPSGIIELVSKNAPTLGGLLGGSVGLAVGDLVSTVLGGANMNDRESVSKALDNPTFAEKLKELEWQLNDLQNARLIAQKETGLTRLIRPALALAAMVAIFADVYFIDHVHNEIVKQVLVMMLVFLVWDIRQIYKFYFGSSDDLPNLPFLKKK